jgi:hypothetical protein
MGIVVFSWNQEGLSFCEPGKASSGTCVGTNVIDIAYSFKEKIREINPSIVVFHTQNEVRKDSHFHGERGLISMMMSSLDTFRLEINTAGDDIGQLQSLLTAGEVGRSLSLQTSIYVLKSLPSVTEKKGAIKKFFGAVDGKTYHTALDPIQGALGVMVTIPSRGKYLFLNINLANSKKYGGLAGDIKRDSVNKIAFIQIIETFHDLVPAGQRADHIIMSGNFNLPLTRVEDAIPKTDVYLRNLIPSIYPYEEGVGNKGPEFLPTEYLKSGRSKECQSSSSADPQCYSSYSWNQRIITHNHSRNGVPLICTRYGRFDIGGMALGTTAGVFATFTN